MRPITLRKMFFPRHRAAQVLQRQPVLRQCPLLPYVPLLDVGSASVLVPRGVLERMFSKYSEAAFILFSFLGKEKRTASVAVLLEKVFLFMG